MELMVFDGCLPCTSDMGLLNFHYRMFHGVLDQDRVEEGLYEVVRNAYIEPPIIMPLPMILAWPEICERLTRVAEIAVMPVIDSFVFRVPYQLGVIPERLADPAPWIEEDMFRRDGTLLPRALPAKTYMALKPIPIRLLDKTCRRLVTGISPSTGRSESGDLVDSREIVERFGIIETWFGYQVSEAVWEILRPFLPLAYFKCVAFGQG